ncbi:SAM-dependent methyltransferase [Acinetobacter calcoaceticus]|uniref:hypothetical protein n=1 Tax=Acinetobacter calcoaceticus TaxID=471 RepID=UPI0018DEBCA3|nr:hypothetical protein [Acinetobacter calcoaceticus]
MNIQDIRLDLVKQAIEKGVPPGAIPGLVDPLAKFVMCGLNSDAASELKDFEQKYVTDLLKSLQEEFGERKVCALDIGKDGSLIISICDRFITANIKDFFKDSKKYPEFFRGRKLIFLDVPPKKP